MAAQECRHVEVVRRNLAGDFADIFLNLVHNVDLLRRLNDMASGGIRPACNER